MLARAIPDNLSHYIGKFCEFQYIAVSMLCYLLPPLEVDLTRSSHCFLPESMNSLHNQVIYSERQIRIITSALARHVYRLLTRFSVRFQHFGFTIVEEGPRIDLISHSIDL